ncbi:MAG TPA: DNA-deoxyinosine glycosylase [Steroidobacteraceae bacterium]|nr:DNA-deoxyinosine glycosylase [Steroidobacteraceae bacterium]
MHSQGFAPIARDDSRVLILGSLPGQESLRRRQYYAQPRNAFWRIMGELVGAGPELSYAARVRRLRARRIAVWDVCAAAFRAGSLDASIVADSVVVNDFAAFFASHRRIGLVCFNGATAQALYRRRVLPGLSACAARLPVAVLPSTSPAHAARSFEAKLAAWRTILRPLPAATAAPAGRSR